MTFPELIVLFLACSAITFTIEYAEIMDIIGLRQKIEKIEFFRKLVKCSFCLSTWVGIFFAIPCFLLLWYKWVVLFYIVTLPFAIAAVGYSWQRVIFAFDEYVQSMEEKRKK